MLRRGRNGNGEGFDGYRREAAASMYRLEEAQTQDRVKERKVRTRRLIQEGAILPEVRMMEPPALEDCLMQKLP